MFNASYLKGDGSFVVLDVLQFHHQEVYLLAFGIIRLATVYLQLCQVTILVALSHVDDLHDAGWVFFSKLEPNVVKNEYQDLQVRFGKALHQYNDEVQQKPRRRALEQKEMKQTVENVLHPCLTICFWVTHFSM